MELTRVSSPTIELVLEVMLAVFAFTPFVNVSSAAVALLISAVMLAVLDAIEFVFDIMLAVFAATDAGKVEMVAELTPPTLFTVGRSAVPPKSFVNLSFPLVVEFASDVYVPPIMVDTNAVVANCVVLVPGAAVGAVGVPVKDGEFIVAFNAKSATIDVILDVFEAIISVYEVKLEVFETIELVNEVMLAELAATDVGKVAMVVELTPPTLFTVGRSDVPPKSFVNLSLPLVVASASGV